MIAAHVWIVALGILAEILLVTTQSTACKRSITYKDNFALYKPCSSSSSYSDSSFPFGDCRGALNGNEYITPNRTRSNQAYKPNCFSTTSTDSNPFWSVDLKYDYLVHRVTVFSYDKGFHRFKGLTLYFDDVKEYTYENEPKPLDSSFHADFCPSKRVRVVKLTKSNIARGDSVPRIQICEVQVYSCMKGRWKESDCSNRCQTNCFDNECDAETGHCIGCKQGYWGLQCDQRCKERCLNNACNQPDGVCTCMRGWKPPDCEVCLKDYWGPQCQHDCSKRCNGADGENYCNRTTGECLKGCKQGYWGPQCDNPCKERCLNNACNQPDGACTCMRGWKPPDCGVCLKDYWGPQCQHDCSKRCNGTDGENYCNRTTSECLKGCITGYWGKNCSHSCGAGCKMSTCNKDTGICECEPGWIPELCEVSREKPPGKEFPIWAAILIALGIGGLIALCLCLCLCLPCRKRQQAQRPVQDPEGGNTENPKGEEAEEGGEDAEGEEPESAGSSESSEKPEEAAEGGEEATEE